MVRKYEEKMGNQNWKASGNIEAFGNNKASENNKNSWYT